MQVWGHMDRKKNVLTATNILEFPATIGEVHGAAMIDLAPAPSGSDKVVRADGYYLHLTPQTTLYFNPPMTKLADVTTNVWVEYRGVQQLDGQVIVSGAEFWPNSVRKSEDSLRTKDEFDPASVNEGDKQSGLDKFFHGENPSKLPAHHDDELQARVNRIGESLVPAYQRALPENDPSRIRFRFQVVDGEHFHGDIAFANGIVLVPWPAVGRLRNDSQIAALLADNIAAALEKQEILHKPVAHALAAASIAGAAAEFFLPGASIATGIATGSIDKNSLTGRVRQTARVALTLMQDAGYDLREAPLAWRLLEPKKPEPLEKSTIGDRPNYFYAILGTTWREQTSSAAGKNEAGSSVVR